MTVEQLDKAALARAIDEHAAGMRAHLRTLRELLRGAGHERDADLLSQWQDEISDCLDFVSEKLTEGK